MCSDALVFSSAAALLLCSKRLPRISYGSGGSGPGSDSVSEWAADPSELMAGGAAGASAAKRQAFLDGESAASSSAPPAAAAAVYTYSSLVSHMRFGIGTVSHPLRSDDDAMQWQLVHVWLLSPMS
jgi:hypothetical protein